MSSFVAGTCEVDVFENFDEECSEPGNYYVDGVLVCTYHDRVLHGDYTAADLVLRHDNPWHREGSR